MKLSRGMGLVEVLAVGAIVGIVMLGVTKMMGVLSKQQIQSNATTSIVMLSRTFQTYLNQQNNANPTKTPWYQTLHNANAVNSAAFTCLTDGLNDCHLKWNYTTQKPIDTAFKLYDQNGGLIPILDDYISNPINGFTSRGQKCITFDATNGNDACPFQLRLTWNPNNCPAVSPCPNAVPNVKGHFVFKPKTASRMIAFNSDNYDFNIVLQAGGGGGGIGVTAKTCATGEFVKGINADGTVNCTALKCLSRQFNWPSGPSGWTFNGSCNAGEILTSCWVTVQTSTIQWLWTSIDSSGDPHKCSATAAAAFTSGRMGLTCCNNN